MNKYIFNGNLGKDAEVRTTASGKVVCSFSVAVQDGYGDNQKTKWVKCSLFGKRAEGGLPQYLKTGTRVLVTGNPQPEAWIDKGTNEARGQLSVFVDDIELLSASGEAQQVPNQQPQSNGIIPPKQQAPQGGFQQPQAPRQQAPQTGGFAEDFDDIPFAKFNY